ncbi:hypothetical protein E1178_06455 [Roseibium hamelinense]|nr:esterase-like activity of phytase family protein [Roseibium hamelinense]MTI43249.1 hypothetical protein [Roseibium hamelinense]
MRLPKILGCLLFLAATRSSYAVELLTEGEPVTVKTRTIEQFHIGRETVRFGQLTYLGGLELISADRDLGGLSGLVSVAQGEQVLAVTDSGFWVAATVQQDPAGKPLTLSSVKKHELASGSSGSLRASWGHDTEALARSENRLYVAAERANAIYEYPWPLVTGAEPILRELRVGPYIKRLRRNKGLEALAAGAPGSALEGSLIAVAERGETDTHDLPAFIIRGGTVSRFSIVRSGRFEATDAVFLPDGDLLLLERRFNLRDFIGMRLRRFSGAEIAPGARLSGEVLLEADFGHQIDNMEAMALHESATGDLILTLLSDNNRSLLQRTLFLRFRLDP